MSDLASTYALQVGVPLSKPEIQESFYPLEWPLEKSVLIHGFGGAIVNDQNRLRPTFPAKVYDHFSEVVAILKPLLEPLGYRLFQIGAQGEPPIKGCEYLCGRTSMLQCTYLVKRAALLIGNDSMWSHLRGSFGGKLVALYGPTSVKCHGPHWRNESETILLESHRYGKRPSYQAMENPKTINAITPESVANAALSLLGTPAIDRTSLYLGPLYHSTIFELVPNVVIDPKSPLGSTPIIRMDYLHDEKILAKNLQLRKCSIIANREIDIKLLAGLKPHIVSMRVEIDQINPEWIKQVSRLGIQIGFMAVERDDDKVLKMRLDYYDACKFDRFIPPTKAELVKDIEAYTQKPLDTAIKWETIQFKSHKYLLSDGKVYLSNAHRLAGRAADSTETNVDTVIDTPDFWAEAAHFYLYTQ